MLAFPVGFLVRTFHIWYVCSRVLVAKHGETYGWRCNSSHIHSMSCSGVGGMQQYHSPVKSSLEERAKRGHVSVDVLWKFLRLRNEKK